MHIESQTFRFYPNIRQRRQLGREFGCARYAYNFGLKLRSEAFKEGKKITYNKSSAAWTEHRKTLSFLKKTCYAVQQQALRHLQTAYSNFFAKRARYPKFKNKRSKQAATYTSGAFRWDRFNQNLTISKVGRLRIKWNRKVSGVPSTVTITKDCTGKYFVTLCLKLADKALLPKTGASVGIDLGTTRLATLSNGEIVANPKYTLKYEHKLAQRQKVLARKEKGSKRRNKQKIKVALIHSKIANSRKDCLHKLTTGLVRRFDVLAIEDLNVKGMVKNHSLAKHISCASFGMFRSMLEYKAKWYGKEVRYVGTFYPSTKTCSVCGHIHKEISLDIRSFNCEGCGAFIDRDVNAAINILNNAKPTSPNTARQAGINVRGDRVRRTGPKAQDAVVAEA